MSIFKMNAWRANFSALVLTALASCALVACGGSSSDSVADSGTATVSISDSNTANDEIAESASAGTAVGIIAQAVDSTNASARYTYRLSDNADGRFSIDATTGAVSLSGSVDFATTALHRIRVEAVQGGTARASQNFIITVVPVSGVVVSLVDSDIQANEIVTSASVGTAVGIIAQAVESTNAGARYTYRLSDNADGRFVIDATTGAVSLSGSVDFATTALHRIRVEAVQGGTARASQSFDITVVPVSGVVVSLVDSDIQTNEIVASANAGTTVGIITQAVDSANAGARYTYRLSDDADGRFVIDATTGVVRSSGALNTSAPGSYSITVEVAVSLDALFGESFTIEVLPSPDSSSIAVIDSEPATNIISELAARDALVGVRFQASNATTAAAGFVYRLSDSANGIFAIDADTGVVTLFRAIDRIDAHSYRITAQAVQPGVGGASMSTSITVEAAPTSIISSAATSAGAYLFSGWRGATIPVYFRLPTTLALLPRTAPVLIAIADHSRDAEGHCEQWESIVREYGFVVLCPQFRWRDWPRTVEYETGGVFSFPEQDGMPMPTELSQIPESDWAFSALEPLFDQIRRDLNLSASTYSLYGHGAGAGFVHRYGYYKPRARVDKAVAANTPWYTLPDSTVDYPYGLRGASVSASDVITSFNHQLLLLFGQEDFNDLRMSEHHSLLPPYATTTAASEQGIYVAARTLSLIGSAMTQVYPNLPTEPVPPSRTIPRLRWAIRSVVDAGYNNADMIPVALPYLFRDLYLRADTNGSAR